MEQGKAIERSSANFERKLEAFGQDLLKQIAGLSQGGQLASKRQKQADSMQEVVMLDSAPAHARPSPFPKNSAGGMHASCEATLDKLIKISCSTVS